jgi:serpin B
VLANAVYFKGDWERAFPETNTKPSQFYASKTTTIDDVPIMHQEGYFRFGQFKFAGDQGLKLLELPYKGQRLSMVVLLPEAVDGLADLEQNLTADQTQQWLERAEWKDVMVWLPKFKVTDQFQLEGVLTAMGMKSAFLPEVADFSGMGGNKELYLSAVIHKAFVEVNEQGTEAAGATVTGPPIPAPVSPEFRADHPFLFLIRDRTTGAILFMGRVADPL